LGKRSGSDFVDTYENKRSIKWQTEKVERRQVFDWVLWFIGWLFTIGYVNLVWWKIILA
jgi:hypothetical protein